MKANIIKIPRIYNDWIRGFILAGVNAQQKRLYSVGGKQEIYYDVPSILGVDEIKEGVTRSLFYYTEDVISDPIDVSAEKVGAGEFYGLNNLFPDYIKIIVNLSPMASACLRVKKQFIFGRGVNDKMIAERAVNERKQTLNQLLENLANDLAFLHRFCCLVKKEMVGGVMKIVGLEHLPAEWVRYAIPDEFGNIDHVKYNPFFNTVEEVGNYQSRVYFFYTENEFESQNNYLKHLALCENRGTHYDFGEVYYYSQSNEFNRTYSRPEYFTGGENLFLTDAAIWQAHERNAANNFFLGAILELTGNKDEVIVNPETEEVIGTRETVVQRQLEEVFGGTKNAGAIMTFWSQTSERNINLLPFQPNNADQLFKDIIPEVRAAIPTVMQVSPLLAGVEITGKLGDSKEKEGAIKFQNEKTEWARKQLDIFLSKMQSFLMNPEKLEILPVQEQIELPDFVWNTLTIEEKRAYIKKKYDIELIENENNLNQPNGNTGVLPTV